jgi:transcription elongation GreA/GreB family factor
MSDQSSSASAHPPAPGGLRGTEAAADKSADKSAGTGEEFLALAREREFDKLEARWMQRLEKLLPGDLPGLFAAAEYLVRKKQSDQAALLLWSLVAAVTEKGDLRAALDVAGRAATIAPEASSLREELISLYRRFAPDVPELDSIIEASGLRSGKIAEALRCVEGCLKLRPGTFVIHVRSRRIGRVVGFQEGGFAVESEKTVQVLPPAQVLAQWERAEAEDFRVMAAFDPEGLRRLAAENPAQLVERTLRVCGGRADFKQLKGMLIPGVIPAEGWSAWWNSVRVGLKRNPLIEVSEGTQPTFALRAAEVGYADRLRASFAQADLFARVKIVLAYLGEIEAGHEGDPALEAEWGAELLRGGREASDATSALAALAAAEKIRARYSEAPDPRPDLARKVAEGVEPAALIQNAPSEEIARAVLESLRDACPERFPELLAAAFPAASLRLCDWISRELARAGRPELLASACDKTTSAPDQHPEAFGWVWRWLLSSGEAAPAPSAGEPERLDRVSATVSLLDLMNRLRRAPRHEGKRAEAREVLSKLRNLVQAGDCRLVRAAIAGTDPAEARRLHEAIVSNEGLPGETRLELLNALRERHPDEFAEKKTLWEDGWVYSTAAGIARRQAEMEKLVNVDLLRNSQEIGKAAARGDLSDNAEFRAALEQRDRLTERANSMRDELRHARTLDAVAISGLEVNVGTAVRLRNVLTGRELVATFLGPWDADPGRQVYSYLAPLGRRFMGKKKGERVRATFDEGEAEYEIAAIEKAV